MSESEFFVAWGSILITVSIRRDILFTLLILSNAMRRFKRSEIVKYEFSA